MKTLIIMICLCGSVLYGREVKTADGVVHQYVEVSRVEPDGVVLTSDAGVEKVPFTVLPESWQKKYGYQPEAAKAFQAKVREANAARAAAIQAQAEADAEREARVQRAIAAEIAKANQPHKKKKKKHHNPAQIAGPVALPPQQIEIVRYGVSGESAPLSEIGGR